MVELDKSANQSTQMAFLIMETMAEIGEPVALSDLARRLEIPKPRTFRFLKTLLAMGYVQQDEETERYRLSLKLFHLGQSIADRTGLLSEARPLMVKLRDAVKLTTTLSIIETQGTRVIDIVRVESPVEIVTRPGSVLDFHASAQGKLVLAFGDQKAWKIVRDGPRKRWTGATITDLDELSRLVELAHQRGWADAPGEYLHGVSALSAPIFDVTNRMIATVTLAGPLADIGVPPKQHLIEAVTATAKAISSNLGSTEFSR
ncbi:IclR family transcriptional regulator [Mesorhizobium sp. CAU 1741]|uniref:IclR family transcriptional regulator n=1 Tax=Mesorhizobium sp. CAU 1741 TaxID=3140366 RepID=UPI00325B88D4